MRTFRHDDCAECDYFEGAVVGYMYAGFTRQEAEAAAIETDSFPVYRCPRLLDALTRPNERKPA